MALLQRTSAGDRSEPGKLPRKRSCLQLQKERGEKTWREKGFWRSLLQVERKGGIKLNVHGPRYEFLTRQEGRENLREKKEKILMEKKGCPLKEKRSSIPDKREVRTP